MSFDFEPEDAWHPDDPPDVLARNLARRLVLLADVLAARGGHPDQRSIVRVLQLAVDIEHLTRRLQT
jgi:hypothetical protein